MKDTKYVIELSEEQMSLITQYLEDVSTYSDTKTMAHDKLKKLLESL